MNERQRIEVRQIEARGRLRELAGIDEWTDEQRAEADALKTELRSLDDKLAALIAAGDEPSTDTPAEDAEARELARLIDAADVGAVAVAAIEHRDTDGATRELQQHLHIGPTAIPLAMLREHRAVTPAPANAGRTQEPIEQPVFAGGLADYLGAYMPIVGAGDATFPVLTTRPTVTGPVTDSTDVGETTGAFAAEALAPGRLQASFFYRRTDAARLGGMGDALADALRRGLAESVDATLSAQIVTDTTQVAAAAADTYDAGLGRYVYSRVDGRYAMEESDLRLAIGSATLADWGGLFRGNNGDRSLVEALREISGGVRVNPHAAAVASNQQDTFIRRGMQRDIVAPMWEGVTLIPDEVTRADTGEIVITGVMLAAFKVIRTDGILRVESQHA